MLFLFSRCNLDAEEKEIIRADVKEQTGEDCLILGPVYSNVLQFTVKKERAVPLQKRLPWPFTGRSRRAPKRH